MKSDKEGILILYLRKSSCAWLSWKERIDRTR